MKAVYMYLHGLCPFRAYRPPFFAACADLSCRSAYRQAGEEKIVSGNGRKDI